MLRKFSPNSVATSKGYIDQTQHGRRTTQSRPPVLLNSDEDLFPVAVPRISAVECVFNKVVPIHDFIRHTDLTGRFPTKGVSDAQFIMVLICLNYIHVVPLLSRRIAHFLAAYSRAHECFIDRDIVPQFERMDNEQSKPLDCYRKGQNITIQRVSLNDHRANKAERDIRTFKNHLIATLCSVDPEFPMAR